MMSKTIVIDGTEIEFEGNKSVLQIARENGFYIPSLCYHPRIGPASMCRVCVVEVEGMRALQTACSLSPKEGLKVHTASPRVLEARKMVVNLLLANGNHDCLSCEVNGECELQDAAYHLGIEAPAFLVEEWLPRDNSAAFIIRDPNKCILCGRCIEGCNSLVVNEVLDFGYRGRHTKVICDTDLPMGQSTCVQCGECVQLCPVGAFIEKKAMGKARRWETKKVRTTCPYCGVGCQLELHIKGDQIIRVTGVEDAQPNLGHLCVKGRYGYDFIYSKDRLTVPLIRQGNSFREASWDEALGLVATKFKQIIRESGPDAVAGVSSSRSINEDSYNMQRLFREVIGTNSIDNCART
jgi:predicted molibdopterin-dependent oxidoreductase YjgC